MNPSKTSEHKYANENKWEEKTAPHEMQMKTNEKKKWHYAGRIPQYETMNAMDEMKSMKARETTSNIEMTKWKRKTSRALEIQMKETKRKRKIVAEMLK